MDPIPFEQVVGHWIGIFVTIAILSYLYADNPFYKLAEHLFVGISIGYVIVIQYFDVLRPNLIDRLTNESLGISRVIYVIPLILVAFLFLRLTTRFSWLGRIAIAFIIGIYAGQNVPAIANTDLIAQIGSTIERVSTFSTQAGANDAGAWAFVQQKWSDAIGLVVLVGGMVAALVYFFFSIEHKGAVGGVARVGVWVLMIGFGASFGYTVQGRISLAIGRAMYVLGTTQSEAEAAQLHSRLVTLVCVVLIFGTVFFLERRRNQLPPAPPAPPAAPPPSEEPASKS
jgi:hypothetical protein